MLPNKSIEYAKYILGFLLPFISWYLQTIFWIDYIKPYVWFLFFPTAFFSALLGGRIIGLFSTIVSSTIVWYSFICHGQFCQLSMANISSIIMFILMGIIFCWTNHRLKEADKKEILRQEQLALTDGLTGIANRRFFDEYIEKECSKAIRNNSEVVLVLLDIDFFKRYNDTYGHPAGDICLQKIANTLRTHTRKSDFCARYGGEEFAVILTDRPTVSGVCTFATNLQKEISILNIAHEESTVSKIVTVSIGIALITEPKNPQQLIKTADKMLYKAKDSGRNTFIVNIDHKVD